MNVWMFNHYALTRDQAGGTRHLALGAELCRRGHQVAIIASNVDYATRTVRPLGGGRAWARERIDNVDFVRLQTPAYARNGLMRLANMMAYGARALTTGALGELPRPDVILGSSPHPFAALAAERLARRYRVPFVLEVRDIWPESLVDIARLSRRHPLVLLFGAIERHLYRRASRVVTLLPGAAGHIVRHGGVQERIAWIPNGVELAQPVPDGPTAPDGRFTIMYAGVHGVANALDLILDAAALLRDTPQVRFRLVGDGPEKPRLLARAAAEGLTNVRFDPPVPKQQVPALLAEATACLLLLKDSPVFRWGVSPNKLFDYMAAGRPVIFCVNSPYDPVAAAKAGISLLPGDPVALSAAVRQLAALAPAELRAMGLRGRAYVENEHAIAMLAARLESVLAAAITGEVT